MGAFVVSEFVNPSGNVVFRISGSVNGKRIRRNFKDRAKALCEAERLNVDAGLAESVRRECLTVLSDRQLRIAELLFESAKDEGAVLALLDQVKRRPDPVSLKSAETFFLTELEKAGCREVTLEVHCFLLRAFFRSFAGESTGDISAAGVRGFVLDGSVSARTQGDRRQRIGQFIRFCLERGWVAEDYTAGIPKIRVERVLPGILSPDEVEGLLVAARADGLMLPYFLCTAFTGLRPTEARRLVRADFHLDGELDCVEVAPRVAKVSQCRQVEVLPVVRDLLSGCLGVGALGFSTRRFNAVRRKAGVFDCWCNDVLRHTYASWHYAIFKDTARLSYTMGNSQQILFQNYIRPMNARRAGKYLDLLESF